MFRSANLVRRDCRCVLVERRSTAGQYPQDNISIFLAPRSYCWHVIRRADHQKIHWKIHKQSCYSRTHKGPLSPFDIAVQDLLQFHDVAVVEIAVMALLKEDIEVDFRQDLEKKAVVLTVEPRDTDEDITSAVAEGRIPPYKISKEVSVVLIELEARNRGLGHPFFENPIDRHWRLERKQLGVAVIFQPTGRTITKRVPEGQLGMWQMIQEKEKTTTNPPMLYWQIMTTNSRIRIETMNREEEEAYKRHYRQTSTSFIEGIFFPEDERSPRMVKVKFEGGYTDKGKSWHKPDLSPYLPQNATVGCLNIAGPLVPQGNISVGGMIGIFFNERFAEDGSKRNYCISHLTKGTTARPWAGPFFAFGRTHVDTYFEPIMAQDLPAIVEFFASGRGERV
jgi:hypothetical protein